MNRFDNNFGAIKFIAAIMVIGGHMPVLLGGVGPFFFGTGIHTMGVRILFTISGYLITMSWLSDPNIFRFGIKRILRIWPPLIVCILISAFVIGPIVTTISLKEYFQSPILWKYFNNLKFNINYNLPGVFENNPYPNAVNGSLWTLPLEIRLYVIIPVILFFVSKYKKNTTKTVNLICIILISCMIYILQQFFWPDWNGEVLGFNLTTTGLGLIPYYLMGMGYALLPIKKALNLPVAIILVLLHSCFPFGRLENEIILFFELPYFIFSLAFVKSNILNKIFSVELSYGIYLYGFLIQQIIIYWINIKLRLQLDIIVLLVVSILITFCCSIISYFMVERPILKLSKHLLKRLRN